MSRKRGNHNHNTPSPDQPIPGEADTPTPNNEVQPPDPNVPEDQSTGAGSRNKDESKDPTDGPAGVGAGRPADPLSGLTEGRIVHYVIAVKGGTAHRPAIVVNVRKKTTGLIDLTYFTARSDFPKNAHPGPLVVADACCYEATATDTVGTWHFPERAG